MIRNISDIIKLYRIHRDIDMIEHDKYTISRAMRMKYIWDKDKKNSVRRKLMTSIIKQLRSIYPYKPKDFSKAKKLYEDYFKMEGHIPSFEHLIDATSNQKKVYLIKWSNTCPYKGDRYSEYYLNESFHVGKDSVGHIFEVGDIDEDKNFDVRVELKDASGGKSILKSNGLTGYRYATSEEIKLFKETEEKISNIKRQIDKKREDIERIKKEKYQLEVDIEKLLENK